jgi:myosin heavy chain 9/10/11/14
MATSQTALATVGFSIDEQFDLFRILAAILHIGNIKFKSDSSDQAMFDTNDVIERVCHLIGVSVKDFTRAVLRPTVKAGREIVTQQRTKRQAEDELAALCKTMYEKTFGSIVERINKALDRPEDKS